MEACVSSYRGEKDQPRALNGGNSLVEHVTVAGGLVTALTKAVEVVQQFF
jgi:hypothetical protein